MTDKISLAKVHKRFATKEVLRGLTLNIEKGQSMVVIGGSGSGKSVMLKSILGLLTPDSGSIVIDGQETVGLAREKRSAIDAQIGMLFQNGALFDSLPVWKNVAFRGIQNEGMNEDEARQIGKEALRRVGLGDELLDLFPGALSGGMHKRVGLARAIAFSPEIIFFDEPTTGLDPIMTDVINHLIQDCVQDLGATTLTITHDMTSVRAIADKTALLYKGDIIWHGDQAALDASKDPFLHQFIHGLAHGPIEVEGQQLEAAIAGLDS